MNYNNLFPKLLKNIPHLPPNSFCYDCINNANYNKNKTNNNNLKCFIPSGRRMVLWFLKHDSSYYSVLLEYQSTKIVKCHFKYISFNKLLASGSGTMIWVTQVGRELSLNKIIYLKGKYCRLKAMGEQVEELRFLIENYINNMHHASFVQLKIPVISNTNSVLSFAGNLNYSVYNVISMSNNYNVHINNFLGVFLVSSVDSMNDCYSLLYKGQNGTMEHYQNALINNQETSRFMKNKMNIKHVKYENIELSDSENDDEESLHDDKTEKSIYMYCLFDKNYKRWKPYRVCKANNLVCDLAKIKSLEEKSSRF